MVCCVPCCFPGDTVVQTKKNGPKRLDSLKVGDKVLTLSPKKNGPIWTKFYCFIHKDEEREAEFLVLGTAKSNVIKVTGEHLIFVYDSNSDTTVATPGSEIKIGDLLLYQGNDGQVKMEPVISIRTEKGVGIYAPLTFSGTFLANGFLASCYADVKSHTTAHVALAPARMWYKLFVENGLSSLNLGENGVLQYATKLSRARDLISVKDKWNVREIQMKTGLCG